MSIQDATPSLDATGNRSAETRNGAPSIYTTATTSNRLDAIDSTARSYDAAGNTSSDGTYAYTYSARNRLSSARLQSTNTVVARYATNAFGERVCKASGAGQCPKGPGGADPSDGGSGSFRQYVYDDGGHLLGEYDASGALIAEHVWLDDTPVAVIKPPGMIATHGGQSADNVAIFAIEPDHLDTPRVIANAAHQVIWRWDSSPFGDTPANEVPGGLEAFNYSLRFPGQQYDVETKTHYNYFRGYEPTTGRYLENDPIGQFGDIASYLYVGSDSLSHRDNYGLDSGGGRGKPGPKPGLTGPHNQTINKIAQCIIDAGFNVVGGGKTGQKERVIPTPRGAKKSRRPDISYLIPGCKKECHVNVGRTSRRTGEPVPREQSAMNDIRGEGNRIDFIPYDSEIDPQVLDRVCRGKCRK